MFGALRLSLAVLVGLSHAGVNLLGINPGVFAVVIFFLISGYVTGALLSSPNPQPSRFYKERLVRLLPSYWTVAALAAAIWFFLAPQSNFLSRSPALSDWIANATVIPLNYYMWSEQDRFTLLPPTWSLGLEMQFYLAAPLLLLRSDRPTITGKPHPWLISAFLLSATFYLVASLPTIMDADIFGYRLLPGVLWIFLAGIFLQRRHYKLAIAGFCIAVASLISIALKLAPMRPFNVETAAGVAIGIPLVASLARIRRREFDEFLGRMSYPFFLCHFLILWLFDYAGAPIGTIPKNVPLLIGWLLLTLCLSWAVHYFCEQPFNAWRRRLRSAHVAKSQAQDQRQFHSLR